MSLFTEAQLRRLAQPVLAKSHITAARILQMEESKATSISVFDVFLSHSLKDAEIILGIKTVLEQQGLKVYVDWVVDSNLDRNNVTAETAQRLRIRMQQSKSLIYAHSTNSPDSKWMPWELGFFDGYRGIIAIMPVAKSENEAFQGQEFLGLYPYIDTVSGISLFVNRGHSPIAHLGNVSSPISHRGFKDWIQERAGIRIAV